MEEKVKEKESEVERVEEQACALIQNKTDEACAVVMETLQAVNHTWANLDHLVGGAILWSVNNVLLVCELYERCDNHRCNPLSTPYPPITGHSATAPL